jgi:hypothetical protein
MLLFGVKRYTAAITSLPRHGFRFLASLAEESENVQNMDRLLNAIRQCTEYIRHLVSHIEDDVFQVIGLPGANREHTIVLSGQMILALTHARVDRLPPHVFWSDALLNMKSRPKTEEPGDTTLTQKPRATHRHMHDSYCEVTLPFKSSREFLEQYTNADGGIRTGKVMEVLDSTAGSVAYKHLLGPEVQTVGTIQEQGFYVVTASVDR